MEADKYIGCTVSIVTVRTTVVYPDERNTWSSRIYSSSLYFYTGSTVYSSGGTVSPIQKSEEINYSYIVQLQ
jgi:hypothetical protein